MAGPQRTRRPVRHRRAFELLASCRDGCTEAIMLAHGFKGSRLADSNLRDSTPAFRASIYGAMLRSLRPRPNGFIEPCLPSPAPKPPAGPTWVHEIKHDGFRLLALKAAGSSAVPDVAVRLLTRRGLDWTDRYPSIAAAIARLSCRSCLIDGEVVICGEDGIPAFDRLRYGRQYKTEAVLFAFDLLELGGKDLRRSPLEERKRELAKLLRKAGWALQINEHIAESGDIVFKHACKLGFEGIVSKRLGSTYLSGRSHDWIKTKNPAAPAVKREAEEDWGKERWR
jgi:bifunctional non-homologous end joining protein LigD